MSGREVHHCVRERERTVCTGSGQTVICYLTRGGAGNDKL